MSKIVCMYVWSMVHFPLLQFCPTAHKRSYNKVSQTFYLISTLVFDYFGELSNCIYEVADSI